MVAVISLVRFTPSPGEITHNATEILRRSADAAQLGAAVVVFPLWALSGLGHQAAVWSAPAQAAQTERAAADALVVLAHDADRSGLGGRYLLVGTLGWAADGAPQAATALLHKGKVGLAYAAGRPDVVAEPWAGEHRVSGELAHRGQDYSGAVFEAHGNLFGIWLDTVLVPPSWPSGINATLDAVLVQTVGGAFVADRAGRRLSHPQPAHPGLTLWHTAE
ncbi:MAG: hypothetical protein LBE08_05190 [Bifidobacteriaceae bacterium]|jgi:hypothetical protein|nr:hypothetical protein [Bifidobacteriaceae bacterium]